MKAKLLKKIRENFEIRVDEKGEYNLYARFKYGALGGQYIDTKGNFDVVKVDSWHISKCGKMTCVSMSNQMIAHYLEWNYSKEIREKKRLRMKLIK